MKRYWLFAYEDCYPAGGMHDLVACKDTIEECKALVKVVPRYRGVDNGEKSLDVGRRREFCGDESAVHMDQAQIYDAQEGRIIEQCYTRSRVKGPQWFKYEEEKTE